MIFTIFGGEGFIGRNLCDYLKNQGHIVNIPSRGAEETIGQNLGNVIYAIGLTGDFRCKLFETVDAQVTKLSNLLRSTKFDSWLYLSSTRVYGGLAHKKVVNESDSLLVYPNLDGIYDLSKLLGEALCLSQSNSKIRVIRLSNVYGVNQNSSTFLSSIINELIVNKKLILREAENSCKDYIALNDVLFLIEKISLFGNHRIYNVASGNNVTHIELALEFHKITGYEIIFEKDAISRRFPTIDTSRIRSEFGFSATNIISQIEKLVNQIKKNE